MNQNGTMTSKVSSLTLEDAVCHARRTSIRVGLDARRRRQLASRAGGRRTCARRACVAGVTAATKQRRLSDAQILATLERVHVPPPHKLERAAPRTRTVTTQVRTGVTSKPAFARLNQTPGERARLTRTAGMTEPVLAATAAMKTEKVWSGRHLIAQRVHQRLM